MSDEDQWWLDHIEEWSYADWCLWKLQERLAGRD
jgi:hypothetical protein